MNSLIDHYIAARSLGNSFWASLAIAAAITILDQGEL